MATPLEIQTAVLESSARVQREWKLPGLAVWAGWRGRTLLAEGFGKADLETGAPVSPDTLFPIASVTKPLTVHALERLVRNGSISWSDRLADLVPDFALSAPDRGAGLTLEQALSHRQPLPPHTWSWVFGDVDRSTFIRERLPHLGPAPGDPGAYRYSNIMYAVAGQVIEEQTGQSWEQFLRDRVLDPCGLGRTCHLVEDWPRQAADLAHPYRSSPSGPLPLPPFAARARHPIAPASELMSTANDLGAWLQTLGDLPPDPACWTPQALIRSERPHPVLGALHAGLGWRLETFREHPHAWHSGQCSGYTALVSVLHEQGLSLALLCNLDGAVDALMRVVYETFDTLLDRHDINWAEYFFPTQDPVPAFRPSPPAPSETFTEGAYHDPGYGSFEVRLEEGRVTGILQGLAEGPLVLKSDGGFAWEPGRYRRRFGVEQTGKSIALDLEPAIRPIVFAR